jgi:dTDP-4-amino-4,6-dideoxygalactose transaminase
MNVPMADLAAQHRALKSELTQVFDTIIEKSTFILGPNVSELEREIADVCGSQYGLGVNSGTDALLLALLAMGAGPGDEIITTPFTFIATVETICLAGATPVMVDIDPVTYNLDPALVAKAITPRTKAIMPVHLFGQTADMNAFSKLAAAHNLRTIADAAQAIGASHHDKPIGTWSDLTTLSFYPTKNLGACGDGGMIVTDNAEFAERIRIFRFHGSGGGYFPKEVGYCSRLDEIQAAILRVKARHLHAYNEARRKNASAYFEQLGGLDGHITLPKTAPGNHHIYHQFTIRVHNGKRDALKDYLASRGIGSGVFYPLPLHLTEAYNQYGKGEGSLLHAELAAREVLSIPVHPELTSTQVDYVAEAVREFYK